MASNKKKQKSASRSANSAQPGELGVLESVFILMGKHGIAEIDWEQGDTRLHVKTPAACVPASGGMMYAPAPAAAPSTKPAPSAPVPAAPAPSAAPSGMAANQKQITSPFVGTFYRAGSPTAEPYAKEGQSIKRGDTLCIIEAMKLMNEIESEHNGKIVKVLVENGQPVEFGEPLFLIEV